MGPWLCRQHQGTEAPGRQRCRGSQGWGPRPGPGRGGTRTDGRGRAAAAQGAGGRGQGSPAAPGWGPPNSDPIISPDPRGNRRRAGCREVAVPSAPSGPYQRRPDERGGARGSGTGAARVAGDNVFAGDKRGAAARRLCTQTPLSCANTCSSPLAGSRRRTPGGGARATVAVTRQPPGYGVNSGKGCGVGRPARGCPSAASGSLRVRAGCVPAWQGAGGCRWVSEGVLL